MYTPIKLDKARNIKLGFEALQLFKKTTGKSMMKLDYENEDFEDYLPLIFYVGLWHEDKELTLEQTIQLIDKHLGIKGAMKLLPDILKELSQEEEDVKNGVAAANK